MRKSLLIALATAALAALVLGGVSYAVDSQPASKATAKVSALTLIQSTGQDTGWTTILSQNLRTANAKDLFIDASLECGLFTRTLVRSKDGVSDTSKAQAGVEVRVLVDGVAADPGGVTFCKRTQELTATFAGILDCTDLNGDGIISFDECTTTPEELDLVLDTLNASSFNFVYDDLTSGVHRIDVQAKIDTDTAWQQGAAEAKALVGKGSVTVEEVRMIKGEDIVLD